MSRYEQWKWWGPKGKSQCAKVKKTETAQIKDGVIEKGHIMNDRKTRSQNSYLPLHIIQEHKDMQYHWEDVNLKPVPGRVLVMSTSYNCSANLHFPSYKMGIIFLASPIQKNSSGKYSNNSKMKNATENSKKKLIIPNAVQVWITLAGTLDKK